MPEQTKLLLTIIGMTLLSGLGDSQGFLHAARTWRDGELVWSELAKSTLGFAFGIVMYWAAIPFLRQFGVFSAEAQTILWFGITMVGVATFSGRFFQWAIVDQSIAVMVLGGISWLLFSHGGVITNNELNEEVKSDTSDGTNPWISRPARDETIKIIREDVV